MIPMQRIKYVSILITSLFILSVVISGCRPDQLLKPTPTCSYGWGPFIGKDVPEWTNIWKEAISASDLEVKDVKVQGKGKNGMELFEATCGKP
jgi:hypothetical protein